MKRLLCIISGLNTGGAETYMMKLHQGIDKSKYQIDFCVMGEKGGVYADLVLSRGGKIFYTHRKTKNPIKCFFDIKRVVKENGYKYVLRVNEHSLAVLDLIAAKAGGARILAMRSTNANSHSRMQIILHKMFSFLPKIVPNVKLAPSVEAAEYTFGKGCVKKGKVHLLNNGIDYDLYRFDEEARSTFKKELGLDGKKVIGHIGRFSTQKNHMFLIDVFKAVSQKDDDTRLVLVGEGELEELIREKVEKLNLKDKVLFLGRREDVPRLMSMFDVLLFPSLYEGMPNVVIESQASGLPSVVSDSITKGADISGLVKFRSLGDDVDLWADDVLGSISNNRKDTYDDFLKKGYQIEQVVERFVQLVYEGADK